MLFAAWLQHALRGEKRERRVNIIIIFMICSFWILEKIGREERESADQQKHWLIVFLSFDRRRQFRRGRAGPRANVIWIGYPHTARNSEDFCGSPAACCRHVAASRALHHVHGHGSDTAQNRSIRPPQTGAAWHHLVSNPRKIWCRGGYYIRIRRCSGTRDPCPSTQNPDAAEW